MIHEMRSSISYLLLLLLQVSCSLSPHGVATDAEMHQRLEAKSKSDFEREYAKYEIKDLPKDLRIKNVDPRSFKVRQTLFSEGGSSISLELGDRWPVSTNSVFRTESRYRLRNAKGKVLASAESVFASQDLEGEVPTGEFVVLLADHDAQAFFIAEKHNWSTERFIVIRSAEDEEVGARIWNVSYVHAPSRMGGMTLHSVDARLLGLHERKLVYRMDGRLYAVPLDRLKRVETLEYPIG